MKFPAYVLYRKELTLMLWQPRGVLDEAVVDEIVAFTEAVEKRCAKPLNRFSDLSALDAVDLSFKFAFQVGIGRRLSVAQKPAVKSAFYVTSAATKHYAKLHAIMTDYSPLEVRLFTDHAAAAKWLAVPVEALSF